MVDFLIDTICSAETGAGGRREARAFASGRTRSLHLARSSGDSFPAGRAPLVWLTPVCAPKSGHLTGSSPAHVAGPPADRGGGGGGARFKSGPIMAGRLFGFGPRVQKLFVCLFACLASSLSERARASSGSLDNFSKSIFAPHCRPACLAARNPRRPPPRPPSQTRQSAIDLAPREQRMRQPAERDTWAPHKAPPSSNSPRSLPAAGSQLLAPGANRGGHSRVWPTPLFLCGHKTFLSAHLIRL